MIEVIIDRILWKVSQFRRGGRLAAGLRRRLKNFSCATTTLSNPLHPIPLFRRKLVFGLPCNRSAVVPGEVASLTLTPSSRQFRKDWIAEEMYEQANQSSVHEFQSRTNGLLEKQAVRRYMKL